MWGLKLALSKLVVACIFGIKLAQYIWNYVVQRSKHFRQPWRKKFFSTTLLDSKYMYVELGALEWWISRSMLDPLFLLNLETNLILYLYPVKCLKFNQSELRIRSWEIKNFARHFRFMFRNRRDSLILKTGFWFFCLYPKKRVVNFSTFANPLYLLLTCAKFAILNIRPTSTWFYSCYMDMWPQRPAP